MLFTNRVLKLLPWRGRALRLQALLTLMLLALLCGGVSACSSDAPRDPAQALGGGGAGGAGGGSVAGGAGAGGLATGGSSSTLKTRVVVYLPSYRGSLATWATRLDFTKVTHVDLSFATIAADGTLAYPDASLASFVSAAHAAGVRVSVVIGGSDTIANGLGAATEALIAPAGRGAFIQKISSYLDSNALDGIDIDFEGSKAVNADYEGFVTALATELRGKGKLTTAALARWFEGSVSTAALQAFDFVNVMVYYQSDPDNSLSPVPADALADDQAALDFWVGRGLSKDKAVFGVPFYGYFWKNAGSALPMQLSYADILAKYGAAAKNDVINSGTDALLLNGPLTIAAKAKLSEQYGGIMAWEVGQDSVGEGSLLNAISQGL